VLKGEPGIIAHARWGRVGDSGCSCKKTTAGPGSSPPPAPRTHLGVNCRLNHPHEFPHKEKTEGAHARARMCECVWCVFGVCPTAAAHSHQVPLCVVIPPSRIDAGVLQLGVPALLVVAEV
jgi:hypothetical protein